MTLKITPDELDAQTILSVELEDGITVGDIDLGGSDILNATSIDTQQLVGADIQNAASGEVMKAQGDGTLAFAPDETGSGSETQTSGFSQITVTTDYNAADGDSVWANSGSSSVTVTLPSPAQHKSVRVINTENTNGVTLSDNAGEGINDNSGTQSNISLSYGESLEVESDGSTWWVV